MKFPAILAWCCIIGLCLIWPPLFLVLGLVVAVLLLGSSA